MTKDKDTANFMKVIKERYMKGNGRMIRREGKEG